MAKKLARFGKPGRRLDIFDQFTDKELNEHVGTVSFIGLRLLALSEIKSRNMSGFFITEIWWRRLIFS
jgi:hypothetical protein